MGVDLQNLFGIQVMWCAQQYSLAETPQPSISPALGHVYEGTIGQQRKMTSLRNPLNETYTGHRTKAIGLSFFSGIEQLDYWIWDWRIRETIGLSDILLMQQSIALSDIRLTKNYWLPTSAYCTAQTTVNIKKSLFWKPRELGLCRTH